ncbi:MAG: KaiC domain-containing protein [Archaeoglobi archaeon]|jgi:KaiC domain protein|nr:KaiC domain-containing protein [Archaeoglobus sp.]TDA27523.1 MAG: KaiC domain-containing protein [Archaeoglobi archaeon]TDA28445.1 MAG: KaiC domain-containing protein [Archaeoglobi archaeon]
MRLSTGIKGLDAILGGGIPKGYVVAVIGSCGTGKTTLGLHFIYEGLKNGENCIVLSFEEDEESIIRNATSVGMKLEEFKNLQIIRLEAMSVKKSFEKVESELPELIRSFNAGRILIDSISILETLFSEQERYQVLSAFKRILKSHGVTAIFTSEADKFQPTSSKYGILEYICDGLICLKMIRKSELDEPSLGLEVVKMRGIKHSRKPKPYTITEKGIIVYEEAEIM